MAYSPLAKYQKIVENKVIQDISSKKNATIAQVLL